MIFGGSYAQLDELITRTLCDTAPKGKVDAAYLFAETKDNEASVLTAGRFLYAEGPARKIAMCDLKGGHGYPGFANWQKQLAGKGVPKKNVIAVTPAKDFPPSTDAEATGIVRYARTRGWRAIYIVAPPLHQLRAFISTVSAVIREKSSLKVYSFHGIAERWEEHVVHSQGIQRGSRSKLLSAELAKIEKYYKKGDLVSAKRMLEYLNKRDRWEN